jgi:hypothetical protein
MAAGQFRLDGKLVNYKMQWVPLRRAAYTGGEWTVAIGGTEASSSKGLWLTSINYSKLSSVRRRRFLMSSKNERMRTAATPLILAYSAYSGHFTMAQIME